MKLLTQSNHSAPERSSRRVSLNIAGLCISLQAVMKMGIARFSSVLLSLSKHEAGPPFDTPLGHRQLWATQTQTPLRQRFLYPGGRGTLAVLLCSAVFAFSACVVIQMGPRIEPLEEKLIEGEGPEKVLLIDIDGPISNRPKRTLVGFQRETGMIDRVREILKKAEEDEEIKAILLRINSPGGTVTSSDILYHEFKTFKEKKNIRIYVSVLDMAASGGYYIAMAGDTIMVHPTSLTGSIGVLALKVNLEGLMEKIGVSWEVVKSGKKKDFMSPFRALTEEERELFQETIDRFHDRFVEIIARNRPQLDLAAVRSLADGRIYEARQALDARLVDHIGYLDDTIELIRKELGQPDLRVVTYHRPGEYKSNIYSSFTGLSGFNFINLDLGLDLNKLSPQFMYLWAP